MKHKIEVQKGDSCITDIVINSRQDEGWYEYIPQTGDRIELKMKNSSQQIVETVCVTVSDTEAGRISINMPTNLEAGKYTYDVTLTVTNEKGNPETYTICDENIYIVKEDEGHA